MKHIDIQIKDIVNTIDWDTQLIFHEIESLCNSHEVNGEVHSDDATSKTLMGAIYIPCAYEENQRKTILGYFQDHGFITIHQAKESGISMKKCEKCIVEIDPKVIVLKSCIINPVKIVEPLEVNIDSCVGTNYFIDLSYHLPTELLCFQDDVRSIVENYILKNIGSDGCLIIDENELFYFSSGMIANISEKILPPVIEDYAKKNAEDIANRIDAKNKSNDGVVDVPTKTSKKGRNRSKKSPGDNIGVGNFMIPLEIVVKAIMETYTELIDIQETYIDNLSGPPKWDDDDELDKLYEGPLYSLCRQRLNTPIFQKACSIAVEAEVEKVLLARGGASMSKCGKGAAKCRSIEESFEDFFPSACYYMQLLAKFSHAILADPVVSDDEAESLKGVIVGQCAWFARKITEYCLFKANLDTEGILSLRDEPGKDNSEVFWSPIDFVMLNDSQTTLRCVSEDIHPLKKLEEIFPGNIGVGLSRMWLFCGQDFYDYCEDDNINEITEFNIDNFISHIEEYCL